MRIHRIRLRHFRGVTDREVTFRAQGVTVIRGANETGKSSLREAVDLILELPHDSKDARIRHVKPVNEDVGPEVELEMTVGAVRFRYRKRWLKEPETVLEVRGSTVEHYTGREAHNRVREILDRHADWALWKALHADQGVNLAQAEYRASRSLVRALDRIASAQLSDDASDDLFGRVKQERERYFTPKDARLRKEHAEVGRHAQQAQEQAHALRQRLGELEAAVANYERLEAELRALRGQLAEADAQLNRLADVVERIKELEATLERLRAESRLAAQQKAEAQGRLEARAGRIQNAERRGEEQARAEAALASVTSRVTAAAKARAEAAEARTAARKASEEAIRRRELAAGDYQLRHDQLDQQQLSERLAAVREGLAAQKEAQDFLGTCQVDEARLQGIEQAHLKVEQVRAQLELAKTTLTIDPERELLAIVDGQEELVPAGTPWQRTVGERTVIQLPGVARLVVEPGRGTTELAGQLQMAESHRRQLLAEAGAQDVAEARALHRRRQAMQNQLQTAEKRVREACRDLSPEEMEWRIQQLAAAIAAYTAHRPPEPALPRDLDVARLEKEAAEAAEREAQDWLADCERAFTQAETDLAAVQREAERWTALVEQATAEAQAAAAELARAREVVPDAELATAMASAEERLAAVEAAVRSTSGELEQLAPDVVRQQELTCRQRRDALAARTREAERERDQLAARLEVEGAQGLYEAAERAQAEADRASRDWQRLNERAEAAKLLWEVLDRQRQQAHLRYHAPLREMIERLGRPVFGPSFSVELNEDLQIARRTLDGVTLPFADLSTGAREQLCVIERLACAALVSPEGGAPVMLDDALGYSDPERLRALGTVLSMAAGDSQVILLTSHPERFRNIPEATVVDLDAS